MNDFEADVLFDLAGTVQNWKLLHDPKVGGQADPEQLLEMCKAAGYSEAAAQQAAKQRAEQRLDNGLPVFQTSFVHQ